MAVMTCYFKSEYVGFEIPFTVILPEKKHVRFAADPQIVSPVFGMKMPVLLLLHDEAEGREEWMHMTSLCRYAQETGIAVILPDCHRSFYSDYVVRDGNSGINDSNIQALQNFTELMYESYIVKELIPYVRKMFPITQHAETTYIGGKGMGGFGALKLALSHEELFGKIFSISGLMDLQWAMDHLDEKREQFQEIFGGLKVDEGSPNDLESMVKKCAAQGRLRPMYLVFNQNHVYGEAGRRWADRVKEFLPEETILKTDEGELDWGYVDHKTEEIMNWLTMGK